MLSDKNNVANSMRRGKHIPLQMSASAYRKFSHRFSEIGKNRAMMPKLVRYDMNEWQPMDANVERNTVLCVCVLNAKLCWTH